MAAAATMVRRRCALCPEGEDCAVLYVAEGQNVAAHQDCLLYSSGFVESEEHNPDNLDVRFDVASVLREIKRGKRLTCNFCHTKGATVGCEVETCRRSYHYFCALCDDVAIETIEAQGIYRVFCPNHDPVRKANPSDEDTKRERPSALGKSPSARKNLSNGPMAREALQAPRRKPDRHKARADFLRKCKQAGLLEEIFEEMFDAFHLAQKKLMDDDTPEAEYEETATSLFDCGLFENVLAAARAGTEEKIEALLTMRQQLDTQIKHLEDLKGIALPTPEDAASLSLSLSE